MTQFINKVVYILTTLNEFLVSIERVNNMSDQEFIDFYYNNIIRNHRNNRS